MTVSTTSNRITYTGNGSSTVFAFPYKFIATTDLVVYVGGVLQTSGYTVGTPTDTGANVTFSAAPALSAAIIILSNPSQLQSTSLPSTGPFPAKSVETMADKLTLLVQRLADRVNRSLTLSDADSTTANTTLPTPTASNILGWNATATALQNVPASSLATYIAYGGSTADIFTGTGAQTVFTLSSNPGSQGNLDVSIAGVTQLPGTDYVWSGGTTLTFSTAPVNAAKILVRYQVGLLQGTVPDGSVTDIKVASGAAISASKLAFLQAGTGAVTRTAQDELRDRSSIKQFGAVGDGVTDDTAAIQLALNQRGLVFIPPGTYKISSTLNVKGNTTLFGAGAGVSILKWYGATSGNIIQDTSRVTSSDVNLNITLRDFELDCNSYSTGSTTGINMYRVGNARYENLYIHHCGASLLNFGSSQTDSVDIWVNNCRVEYARTGDGIQGVGTNVYVSNCYVFSCGDTCYAMLYDFSGTTNPSTKYPSNIVYSNCIAKGEWVNGTFTGSGNSSQLGFALGPYAVSQPIYCTIEKCICDNLYVNVWMVVFSKLKLLGNTFKAHANLLTGGVRLDGIENAIIDGNSFDVPYASANTYYCGLLFNAQRNTYGASNFDASTLYTSIVGNVFQNTSTPAIAVYVDPTYAAIRDMVIADNIFVGATKPIQFLPATGSGTSIFDRIQVTGNTVNGTATAFCTALGVAAQYRSIRLSENTHGTVPVTSGDAANFQISGGYLTTVSMADSVATTVFTIAYQQTVQIEAYVAAADIRFSTIGTIVTNFGASRIAWKSDGANCVLSLSGNNVQITQSGIGTQIVNVRVKFVS